MLLKRREGRDEPALPRLHHWLVAAIALFAVMLIVPVIAGLT